MLVGQIAVVTFLGPLEPVLLEIFEILRHPLAEERDAVTLTSLRDRQLGAVAVDGDAVAVLQVVEVPLRRLILHAGVEVGIVDQAVRVADALEQVEHDIAVGPAGDGDDDQAALFMVLLDQRLGPLCGVQDRQTRREDRRQLFGRAWGPISHGLFPPRRLRRYRRCAHRVRPGSGSGCGGL